MRQTKQISLRRLFDFWTPQSIIIIFILKILQFFRTLGAKAESAGWRKVTGIFVRNEYSKFVLTCFRLKYAPEVPETTEKAKKILIEKLRSFIRNEPQLNWAVRVGILFKPKRIHLCDIMEAETDSNGNITKIIPHFDPFSPVTHFHKSQVSFIMKHITVVYNTMRYEPAGTRLKQIEKALKTWISANAGYNLRVRQHLTALIDRIMCSVFLFCEVKPGVSDGKTPSRFHVPDPRKIRHPGWGMLCIAVRFSGDLSEVDLWWQFSHVTADGAPMQEIMNKLKTEWGIAGELGYPQLNNVLSVPDIVYCGDKIFRARVFVDFSVLTGLREKLNRKWINQMGGKATLAEFFLWGISSQSFLRNKKFLVPVDLGLRDGERELGLVVIRPGKFRRKAKTELQGFLKFHQEFSRKLQDVRDGHGESDEFLQLCTMLHPSLYHAAKILAPQSLQEILGTIGFSMIRDADMFVGPFTDFQVNGFLTLGNISIPTVNGKKAGSLCIGGDKKRIRFHLEAISNFMADPEKYFADHRIKRKDRD